MLPKLVVAAVVLLWTQGGASDDQPLYRTTWDATAGSYGTLHVTLREEGDSPPALALSVGVDGREDHVIVVTTGVGRTEYASIVGPLSAGRHTLELRRSQGSV